MAAHRVVVMDNDEDFLGEVRRALAPHGFEIDAISGRRAALKYLDAHRPDIVFLAVERPRNAGFSLFTEVKKRIRSIPVVLATSTVPKAEFLQHQKLTIHADAYLDKRETSAAAILATANVLLDLDFDVSEISALSRRDRAGFASQPTGDPEDLAGAEEGADAADAGPGGRPHDDDVARILQALGLPRSALDSEPVSGDPRPEPPRDFDRLQEEVEHLRHELQTMQRASSSSPFADEYLKLASDVRNREREAAALRRTVHECRRKIATLQAGLLDAAGKVVETARERDAAKERWLESEARRGADAEEHERGLGALRAEHAARVEASQAAHAEAKQALLQDQARGHRLQLDDLRATHAKTLNVERDAHRRAQEALLADHERAVVAERETRHLELAKLAARHRSELETRHQEWERTIQALEKRQEEHRLQLEQTHAAALENQRHESLRKIEELTAARDATVEAERVDRDGKLRGLLRLHHLERERERKKNETAMAQQSERLRAEFEAEREEEKKRHRAELDELNSAHERALDVDREAHGKAIDELAASHQEALNASVAECNTRVVDLNSRHEQERERQQREHEAAVERERERLRAEFETEREEEKKRHRAELDELAASHHEALNASVAECKTRVVDLNSRHEQERERQQREHEAAVERERERLRAEFEAGLEEERGRHREGLDELKRTHQRALDAEREAHRKAIERLVASHHGESNANVAEWKARVADVTTRQEQERERQQREHEAAVERERERLRAEFEAGLEEERGRHREELDELKSAHERALDAERLAHRKANEELDSGRRGEWKTKVDEWKARVEELTRQHEKTLRARREEDDARASELAGEHRDALIARTAEYEKKLLSLIESHKIELKARDALWKDRIDEVRRKLEARNAEAAAQTANDAAGKEDEALTVDNKDIQGVLDTLDRATGPSGSS